MHRSQRMIVVLSLLLGFVIMLSGCSKHESEVVQAISSEDTNLDTSLKAKQDTKEEQPEEKTQEETTQRNNKIFVYICGAVRSPGVYEMDADSRMFQLIEMAGGMTEEADSSYLNQASLITDGDKVYLPTKAEVEAGNVPAETENTSGAVNAGGSEAKSFAETGKININTASAEELMTVNGIGPSRAESIISYREQNGAFQTIEDIMNVDGIKEGIFNKVKDQITIG